MDLYSIAWEESREEVKAAYIELLMTMNNDYSLISTSLLREKTERLVVELDNLIERMLSLKEV